VQDQSAQHCSVLPQLEQAAIAQLQSETIASETDVVADDDEEQGRADFSNLQVLLHSSENFGPVTVRDLTVRFFRQIPPIGSALL
jgi:hypothetical protein